MVALLLAGNRVSDAGVKVLAPYLAYVTQLQTLNLHGECKFCGNAGVIAVLLTHTVLSACSLRIIAIAVFTVRGRALRTGNNIADAGVQALSPWLGHVTQLQALHLGGECMRGSPRLLAALPTPRSFCCALHMLLLLSCRVPCREQ